MKCAQLFSLLKPERLFSRFKSLQFNLVVVEMIKTHGCSCKGSLCDDQPMTAFLFDHPMILHVPGKKKSKNNFVFLINKDSRPTERK